jgi:hypothetical protein
MSPADAGRLLEAVARDLDLAVFTLERDPPSDPAAAHRARERLRRELESLRDRVEDVARALQ